ncbi:GTPase subunit of restriction endonuclease [Frankia canadensis]|uniref:GTPase subunit of restriction endonuclease n=1 Tax=Frankia canadensis TaxID=1836972 RepID=A0A2I2KLP5_9ACTN|nr:AAA family ATPase [Frankia canadensis]SNQ46588.1 GTPase subunit of restriction endonuclease [Frankia canadensis]SOU53878.1 GTPase subunit of restriction endonuclease [Frankia canadensis]
MTGKEQVYAATRVLLEKGFAADDSAFMPGRPVWTQTNAENLAERLEYQPVPTEGKKPPFPERYRTALEGADPDVVQLAAELLYLNLLAPSDIKGVTKRVAVRTVLKAMPRPVAVPAELDAALDGGITPFGPAVAYRSQQIAWMARVAANVSSFPHQDRRAALDGPWEFRALLDATPNSTAHAQRLALLHLAFPDTFPDTVSINGLKAFVSAHAAEVGALTGDLERDFAAIRVAIEARGEPFDLSLWLQQWAKNPPDGQSNSVPYRRGWLVRGASVQGRNLVPRWLAEGYCSISMPGYPQVDVGLTRSEIAQVVRDVESGLSPAQERTRVTLLDHFLNRMAQGDLVVTVNEDRVHVGVVTGGPYWLPGQLPAHYRREVRWLKASLRRGDLTDAAQDRLTGQASLVDLGETAREIAELVDLDPLTDINDDEEVGPLDDVLRDPLGSDGLPKPTNVVVEQPPLAGLPEPTAELACELLVDSDWLVETVDLLEEKRQLVLYGPPGTGKTYLAQEVARFVAEQTNGSHRLVQFHPSYAYEDFVEGFRPGLGADGTFRFAKEFGPLRRLVEDAAANPSGAYVLVIDEINRANLAKVFGELYFLLEYRNRMIELQYSAGEEFRLPANVFVIGTMNTADRSIALVDAAMRRRFAWQPLFPGEPPVADMLRRWLAKHDLPAHVADLLDALNAAIGDRDAAVGPSYLMNQRVASEAGLARIWRTQILPLLEERHLGEHADVAGYVRDRYGLATLLASALPAMPPAEESDSGADAAGQ